MKRFVTFEPIENDVSRFETLEEAVSHLKNEIYEDIALEGCIPEELSDCGEGAFVAEVRLVSEMRLMDSRELCEARGAEWNSEYEALSEVALVPVDSTQSASVIDEVRNERLRQRGKGYDEEHDDTQNFEFFRNTPFARPLIGGAIAFLRAAKEDRKAHESWPWERVGLQDFIPPDSPRDALIKAAAMLVAEVERMDRAKAEGRTK